MAGASPQGGSGAQGAQETPGQMACAACGWWPPLVRVRKGKAERASEGWRWRRLYRHVDDVADAEWEDGNDDGAHVSLLALVNGRASVASTEEPQATTPTKDTNKVGAARRESDGEER